MLIYFYVNYYLLKYNSGNFIVLDDLQFNINYTIREIDNSNLPDLFKLLPMGWSAPASLS